MFHFITYHQALGLFVFIFAEELGIPLPAPGDAAIAYAGYLTTIGGMSSFSAYAAVILAARSGSFLLLNISRRLSHAFLNRFGAYIGLDRDRMLRAERAFRKWGPWTIIIGRQIPGMRAIITVLSGTFDVPTKVFVPCVALSSAIWAVIFIELGRLLGRHIRAFFHLVPSHLLPLFLVPLVLIITLYMVYEHAWRPHHKISLEQENQAKNE
ncbi:MAG: DedA family protein [Candidatus Dormibacteraceae bacterium]